ncbi:hypothetical protein ABSA28_00731 [Candidatus Hepatincolaceae symbiont of Richtersius coronifer]
MCKYLNYGKKFFLKHFLNISYLHLQIILLIYFTLLYAINEDPLNSMILLSLWYIQFIFGYFIYKVSSRGSYKLYPYIMIVYITLIYFYILVDLFTNYGYVPKFFVSMYGVVMLIVTILLSYMFLKLSHLFQNPAFVKSANIFSKSNIICLILIIVGNLIIVNYYKDEVNKRRGVRFHNAPKELRPWLRKYTKGTGWEAVN